MMCYENMDRNSFDLVELRRVLNFDIMETPASVMRVLA